MAHAARLASLGVALPRLTLQIVEWSDGSLTLHVGAEVLALVQQRTGTDHTTHTTLFAAAEAAAVDPSAAAAAAPSAAGHKRPRAETVLEAQVRRMMGGRVGSGARGAGAGEERACCCGYNQV